MGRHQSRAPTQALFRTQAARPWAAATAAVSQGTLTVLRRVSRMHRRSKSTTSATAARRGDGGCARLALAGHGIAPCASCWWPRVSKAAPGGGVAPSSGQTSAQSSWPSSHLVRKRVRAGVRVKAPPRATPKLRPRTSRRVRQPRHQFHTRDLRFEARPSPEGSPGSGQQSWRRRWRCRTPVARRPGGARRMRSARGTRRPLREA